MNIEKFLVEIGPLLRGMVAEAITIIQNEAGKFVAKQKLSYGGNLDDVVTNADIAAQAMYVQRITKEFPMIGLIGEENNLKKSCEIAGEDIYITIDPLDGTKAFARGQSHGVGTMIAVVRNGEVIASYIGDINTGEIYGFAPDAPVPSRLRFGVEAKLDPKSDTPLASRYALLNCPPSELPSRILNMVRNLKQGGLFKSLEVSYGSYGIMCARLWKGEVGAIILDPGYETPWDSTPVIGIMERLGFTALKYNDDDKTVIEYEEVPPITTYKTTWYTVFIHKTNKEKLLST